MHFKIFAILLFLIIPLFGLDKVSIQLKWHHQFQFAGYYAAVEQGYYQEEGLDVTLKDRNPAINNIEQVFNGESQYGIGDSALLVYRAKKKPIVIVAPIFQHSPSVFITLKSSGIDSPYKMVGKRISMYPNDIDGLPLLAMLHETGIMKKGFYRIETNFDINELMSKQVDTMHGYSTNEPYLFKEKGFDVNVIYPQNFGVDLYGDMLFTTQNELTNHPKRIEAMKRATIKGWKYAIAHKEEIIRLIQTKYNSTQTTDKLMFEANGIIAAIAPESVAIGTLNGGRLDYMQQMLEDHGLITSDQSFGQSLYHDARGIRQKILEKVSFDSIVYISSLIVILLFIMGYFMRKLQITKEELKALNLQTKTDKQRYKALMENASDGVFIIDLDGKVVECSYQAAKMLGYSIDEMKHLYVYDWDIAHTKEEAIVHVRNTPSTPISFETKHRRKDGSIYDASITVVKIDILDNSYIYASALDITHEKALENALLATNKQLTNISENVPGVIYTYQLFPDGRACFPYASEHIYDVYGVTPIEVREDATKVFDVLHPDDIEHITKSIMYSKDHLSIWEDEYRVNHPDKGIIWLKGLSKPEEQPDGSMLWYGYIYETTVQKQLEIELMEKKEAAEASARAKSEFLAAMSHEIRTPMNGVLGMLGLLDKSKLDLTQKHQVHVATSSAASLLGLINDILDFSKIEAGKMDLEMLEFDLKHELEDFVQSVAFKAKEKGLQLILNTDEISYANIITDPGRLRQILTNLVGNAIKFTNRGQIYINASLHKDNDTQGHLRIDVIDTGIGIPPEKIATLFEAFTQADGSTTRKYGGSGLGLSIVKKLCELMGGTISAKSAPGEGSTFSVNLTLNLGSDQILTRKIKQVLQETQEEKIDWPVTTRILLVEDNATNQLVANGMLESLGLYADVAANGLEAIEAIRISNDTQPYSIVLMDCQMPEMDGYDATRAIRAGEAGEENRDIPIIAMTANAMQGDREKCTNAGMDDYIAKPINLSVLQSALVKWILKEDISQSSHSTQPHAEQTGSTDFPLWDESDSLNRLGNNTILLNKIMESFMLDGPKSLLALAKALEENNSADVQLHAHSLKGSSGNVSAIKLYNISKNLEKAAKNNDLAEVRKGFNACEQTLNETLAVFKTHLEKEIKPAQRKKRLDPLKMAIKLQNLKKELGSGMLIDTEALGIFGPYLDEAFTQKMTKLKEHIERFETDRGIALIDIIMSELDSF